MCRQWLKKPLRTRQARGTPGQGPAPAGPGQLPMSSSTPTTPSVAVDSEVTNASAGAQPLMRSTSVGTEKLASAERRMSKFSALKVDFTVVDDRLAGLGRGALCLNVKDAH